VSAEEKEGAAPGRPAAPGPPPAPGGASPPPKAPPPPKLEDLIRQPVPSPAADALREAFPDAVEEVAYFAGEVTVRVRLDRIVEICRFLKDDPRTRMNLLSDLSAADHPRDPKRFEINYHVYSIPLGHRIRVKVRAADGESVPTVTKVWATANWHEREAYDLFGIRFEGHPDLTRILLPDDWKGHPLRKEYPLEGFPEQHPRFR
jgi:NADH-quinone oxidoreductase subunit C